MRCCPLSLRRSSESRAEPRAATLVCFCFSLVGLSFERDSFWNPEVATKLSQYLGIRLSPDVRHSAKQLRRHPIRAHWCAPRQTRNAKQFIRGEIRSL